MMEHQFNFNHRNKINEVFIFLMKHPSRRFLPSIVCLNTLEVIARRGSVTAAANELGLTQGAVSRQLLDLEDFLGLPLFERRGARLSLNADGTGYIGKVRPLLDQLESASIAASAARQGDNVLHVSLPNTFGLLWVMPRLEGFAAAYPHLQMHLANHAGQVSLRETGLDAAVVFSEEGFSPDVADCLHRVQSLPVAAPPLVAHHFPLSSPQRLLSGEQLAQLPLLHQTTAPNGWASYLRQWGLELPVPLAGLRYSLVSFALKAAEEGLGAALVPEYACAMSLATGRVVQLNQASAKTERGYYLLQSPDRQGSPALTALRNWLLARADEPIGITQTESRLSQ